MLRLLYLILRLTFFVLLSVPAGIFAQEVTWAKNAGGSGSDYVQSITTDLDGNVYFVGRFKSSSITFGDFTLTNSATNETDDIFIVKMSSTGEYLWAKSAGGSGSDYVQSEPITTDLNGNLYFSGNFGSSSITFGSFTLYNNSMSGIENAFIVKISSNGEYLWAKGADDSNNTNGGFSVATDLDGNVYWSGGFVQSITFGSYTFYYTGTSSDSFLIKMNTDGEILWAKSFGGNLYDYTTPLTLDSDGNIYFTGLMGSPSITFGSFTLTNNGSWDSFIVKMNNDGDVLWAKGIGGSDDEYGISVITDLNDNIYFTGRYKSSTLTFGDFTISNNGMRDFYIGKINSAGEYIWVKGFGGSSHDYCISITTDLTGNVYLTGGFESSTMILGDFTLSSIDTFDIFIAKMNSSGEYLWAESYSADSSDFGKSVTTDNVGNVYLTGDFMSPTLTLGDYTLTNFGNNNIFIAKYGDTPVPVELTSFSAELLGSHVILSWQTATEVNNYGFEVERCVLKEINNDQWEILGFVQGHGNSNSPKYYEYTDENILAEQLEYRLKQIDTDGTFKYYYKTAKVDARSITDFEEIILPTEFVLNQNYPNPFNPITELTYSIPKKEHVQIKIFDLLGNEIITLVNEQKQSGDYKVEFNATYLSSGIYLCKIISGNYIETKKMVLLK